MKYKTIIIFLLSSAIVGCGKKLHEGESSKEKLIQGFISALSTGEAKEIRKYLIRKKEFVEAIHPHTPEAKGIDGETYWNTMIIERRDILTNGLVDKFRGKSCSVAANGNEHKKELHGPVTFYREVPVKIVCGDKDKIYTDENRRIFGIIVEKNGVYKVLNIFGR